MRTLFLFHAFFCLALHFLATNAADSGMIQKRMEVPLSFIKITLISNFHCCCFPVQNIDSAASIHDKNGMGMMNMTMRENRAGGANMPSVEASKTMMMMPATGGMQHNGNESSAMGMAAGGAGMVGQQHMMMSSTSMTSKKEESTED